MSTPVRTAWWIANRDLRPEELSIVQGVLNRRFHIKPYRIDDTDSISLKRALDRLGNPFAITDYENNRCALATADRRNEFVSIELFSPRHRLCGTVKIIHDHRDGATDRRGPLYRHPEADADHPLAYVQPVDPQQRLAL
jgi:hypothetical protein